MGLADTRHAGAMPKPDPEILIAEAALKLLAKTPWPDLTLAAVAKSARLPLAAMQPLASSKSALFGLILRRLGQEAAARYVQEPGSAHDRLFEVAMCWFDVAAPHKKAVRSIYEGLRRDPVALIAAHDGILEAANWLMALAGADTGPALPLRALGFGAVLGRTVPVWLNDGPDMTKTMACLDSGLRRGEEVLERVGRTGGNKQKQTKKKKT